jgi:hypothetical protein
MLDFSLDSNVNLEFDYRTFDLLAIEEISVTLFCIIGKVPKQDSHHSQIAETTNDEVSSNELPPADVKQDMGGLMLHTCEDGTFRRVGIFYVEKLTRRDQFMKLFSDTTLTII